MGESLVATAVCAEAVWSLNDPPLSPLGMGESLVATTMCAAAVHVP
jgi:hypothetical protein